jgi:hypothetical protein
MSKAIIDKINEVWRARYGESAEYTEDDYRCCARIQALADDRDCWLSNAKILRKQINKTEKGTLESGTKELNQRLLDTLDRWERAYTGYALMTVAPQQRRETLATGTPSEENIGNLIKETRKLLRVYDK